jgi:transposase
MPPSSWGGGLVLGDKADQEEFVFLTLDMLVPEDDFYRRLESAVDLSWLRSRVAHLYSDIGRPSLDPEVFLKLQLILYLEGLRSERQLMRLVADRLSWRRYLHYRLSEAVPDHSTLSKTRTLWGQALLQEVFDYTVRLCQQAGMVSGVHLSGDKSIVPADAALDSLAPRRLVERADDFIQRLYAQDGPDPLPDEGQRAPVQLSAQPGYPAQLPLGEHTQDYRAPVPSAASASGGQAKSQTAEDQPRLSNATHVSTTDPQATLLARENLPPLLAYKAEMWTDSRAGVITHADAALASRPEEETVAGAIRRQRAVFGLPVASVSLDKAYGQGRLYRYLDETGIVGYVPHRRYVNSNSGPGLFRPEDFSYDAERQAYRCPAGCELHFSYLQQRWPLVKRTYQANPSDCRACTRRAECTKAKRYRRLDVSSYQPYYEQMDRRLAGPGARLAAVARRTGPELAFAEGKQWRGLERAKYRGLAKFKGQVLLSAAAINLKKLLNWIHRANKGAGRARLTSLSRLFAFSLGPSHLQAARPIRL